VLANSGLAVRRQINLRLVYPNELALTASLRLTEDKSCLEVIAKDEICRADANQSEDNH
jgi:hypothetical protein